MEQVLYESVSLSIARGNGKALKEIERTLKLLECWFSDLDEDTHILKIRMSMFGPEA